MADNSRSPSAGQPTGPTASPASSGQHRPSQQSLSCTYCRQRKIKCDKVHPCSPCQKSSLNCVFPERVRHPKKRRNEAKAANEELLRRLGRMEELIERMKDEGQELQGDKADVLSPADSVATQDTGPKTSEAVHTDVDRYIGGAYWRSLTNEVEGIRQTMDDVSDGEEGSPASTPSVAHTSHSSFLFGASPIPTREFRLLHPSSDHMLVLCEIYGHQVEPMFKLMHMPTLRNLVANAAANIHEIPSGNYVEPLLFSMYYAAITALTPTECLHKFHESQDFLLSRYRTGTETALANADMMNTTELGTVQALAIFILAVRANDDSQFSWTLISVAVRLGHALGLHRENSRSGLSPFTTEMRRRLWWQLITLDMRACEERGSDPVVMSGSFNTKMPLNINDADIDPESTSMPVERQEFTEMTKSHVSHIVWANAIRIAYEQPIIGGAESSAPELSFDKRVTLTNELEKELANRILVLCDTSDPLAWVTSVICRLIISRVRLALYHPPIHDQRSASHHTVSRDTVLKVAIENIEYSNLIDTSPMGAPWRWFFKTYVQWHCLAATLAELCVQNRGPLVERAWRIVDIVFDKTAARVADSKHGMLWRPIKKLMNKAQAKRSEGFTKTMNPMNNPLQQQALPPFQFPHTALDNWTAQYTASVSNQTFTSDEPSQFQQELPMDDLALLDVNESFDTINWAGFDEFMQDFEMKDQPASTDMPAIPMDNSTRMVGAWW